MHAFKKICQRGWGHGGEMTQALYAHMNNKQKKKCQMYFNLRLMAGCQWFMPLIQAIRTQRSRIEV
jgi:hypothetical protein